MSKHAVGIGGAAYRLAIYIANRPANDDYSSLNCLQALAPNELAHIVANNTNHWRKAFNVFAKVLWQLDWPDKTNNTSNSWQQYRESHLLQAHSLEALLFSPPDFQRQGVVAHIVAGKTYAQSLALPPLTWRDNYFAMNKDYRLIVCPYLDYRQLSNARIGQLVSLISLLDNS